MLKNKLAFITGSTRGIGREIAHTFAKNGANLILNARNETKARALADELESTYGINVSLSIFDISDHEAVKKAFKELFKITKTLDILVNNAGILDDALLPMVTQEQVEKTFAINTFGALYVSQYAARMMIKNGAGSLINISSIVGVEGNEGQSVYAGSKAAVIGITKSMAKEFASKNICVNAIAPGFIDTNMTRGLPPQKYQERLDSIKMRRIGTPRDIANTALYLASDLSRYVTGQVIGVDGGMLI